MKIRINEEKEITDTINELTAKICEFERVKSEVAILREKIRIMRIKYGLIRISYLEQNRAKKRLEREASQEILKIKLNEKSAAMYQYCYDSDSWIDCSLQEASSLSGKPIKWISTYLSRHSAWTHHNDIASYTISIRKNPKYVRAPRAE